MNVNELTGDVVTLPVSYRGHVANVTYRPSTYTADFTARYERESLVDALVALIDSWDVTEDDGAPLHITTERLGTLPFGFLTAVFEAVARDAVDGAK